VLRTSSAASRSLDLAYRPCLFQQQRTR